MPEVLAGAPTGAPSIHFVPIQVFSQASRVTATAADSSLDSKAQEPKVGVQNPILPKAAAARAKEPLEEVSPSLVGSRLRQPIPFLRVRQSLKWWQANKASAEVLKLIQEGVKADFKLPGCLSWKDRPHTDEEVGLARKVLRDYLEVGAVKVVPSSTSLGRLPWFLLTKEEATGGG